MRSAVKVEQLALLYEKTVHNSLKGRVSAIRQYPDEMLDFESSRGRVVRLRDSKMHLDDDHCMKSTCYLGTCSGR